MRLLDLETKYITTGVHPVLRAPDIQYADTNRDVSMLLVGHPAPDAQASAGAADGQQHGSCVTRLRPAATRIEGFLKVLELVMDPSTFDVGMIWGLLLLLIKVGARSSENYCTVQVDWKFNAS
jgi:hypothetical protein